MTKPGRNYGEIVGGPRFVSGSLAHVPGKSRRWRLSDGVKYPVTVSRVGV